MAGTKSASVKYSQGGLRADTRKLDQEQKRVAGIVDQALSDRLDETFGSTRGMVLVRGETGWVARTPSTVNHVLKFNGTDTVFAAQILPKVEVLWNRTLGTNIGNLTVSGGLASAFDGVKIQVSTSSAQSTGNNTGDGFIGKTFPTPQIISKMVAYGNSNNGGFNNAVGAVIIEIYGKNGTAPSSATDGTLISADGTLTTASGHWRRVWTTDQVNSWDHAWVRINNTNLGTTYMSELEIYVLQDATS